MEHKAQTASQIEGACLPIVKSLLAEILCTDERKLNPTAPFVDLGLDSILGVEFTKMVQKTLAVEVAASKLYEYTTLESLSQYIDKIKVETVEQTIGTDSHPQEVVEANSNSQAIANSDPLMNSVNTQSDEVQIVGSCADKVLHQLSNVLGTSVEKIETSKEFVDLGLDSILGVEFVEQLNRDLGTSIKATKLYEFSNVDCFMAHVDEQISLLQKPLQITQRVIVEKTSTDESSASAAPVTSTAYEETINEIFTPPTTCWC